MTEPVVTLRAAVVRYRHREPICPFDLEVVSGDRIIVTGPSGHGKTTLLRLIAGLVTPASGAVIRRATPAAIGYVFQEPRLLLWQRVIDNVALPMIAAGISKADARERARRALRDVALEENADDWPLTLSGGMAQRVNLARALAIDPGLLLLDEPFSALDAQNRSAMKKLIVNYTERTKTPIVCATHFSEVADIATKNITLK